MQRARAIVLTRSCSPRAQREGAAVDHGADHPPQAQGEGSVTAELDDGHHPQTSRRRMDLGDYVQKARDFVKDHHRHAQGECDRVDLEANHRLQTRQQGGSVDLEDEAYHKLFVDLASPYPNRLGVLKAFWVLDEKLTYALLEKWLSDTFNLLYTKMKMVRSFWGNSKGKKDPSLLEFLPAFVRLAAIALPLAAIGLFHNSHRESYNDQDVNVTIALFTCTALLEAYAYASLGFGDFKLSRSVSQYSLIGFFARNQRHTMMMSILSFFGGKDFLDQHWCMWPRDSSIAIIGLVLKYVKKGWAQQINDDKDYLKFNHSRGQRTLEINKCEVLGWSLRRPFDESVLLWHITTYFCFYMVARRQEEISPPLSKKTTWAHQLITSVPLLNVTKMMPLFNITVVLHGVKAPLVMKDLIVADKCPITWHTYCLSILRCSWQAPDGFC
ncbi:hypothetical protein VPH35_092133 [Triticum aestivum]|uniref:DUF4220 domain-containing protein n=1 Tax=Triticum turgidum subsp. durum TaxID=4567 RepID=A0A9R1AQ03_TRITD|nr:unnamed protein product [Triticum turgidum subsp. durum]